MKTYKPSSAGPIIVAIVAVLILVVVLLDSSKIDTWVPWLFLAILLFAIADMKFGIYAGARDGKFFEVKHFIYRREMEISDIAELQYQPTWAFGENMRSVYVIDRSSGKSKFKLTNGAYSLKTLATIIRDLREENRSVRLDEPAQDLLKHL